MTYRYQVNTHGDPADSFAGNAVTFETSEEARDAAENLFDRWTAVKFWRVVDSSETVHFTGP